MSAILDGYLPEDETARALDKSPRTLKRWRAARTGPPFTKIGNQIYYRLEAVRDWLAVQERQQVRSHARRARAS